MQHHKIIEEHPDHVAWLEAKASAERRREEQIEAATKAAEAYNAACVKAGAAGKAVPDMPASMLNQSLIETGHQAYLRQVNDDHTDALAAAAPELRQQIYAVGDAHLARTVELLAELDAIVIESNDLRRALAYLGTVCGNHSMAENLTFDQLLYLARSKRLLLPRDDDTGSVAA